MTGFVIFTSVLIAVGYGVGIVALVDANKELK